MRYGSSITTVVALALLLLGVPVAHGAPPGNEGVESATTVAALPFTDVADVSDATRSPGDPECL